MNIKSETIYSLIAFYLKHNPIMTKIELLEKIKEFEILHQSKFGQPVFFYPNLSELEKILIDHEISEDFKEIHDFFIFSVESNIMISKIEPDLDIFSLNQLSLLLKQ